MSLIQEDFYDENYYEESDECDECDKCDEYEELTEEELNQRAKIQNINEANFVPGATNSILYTPLVSELEILLKHNIIQNKILKAEKQVDNAMEIVDKYGLKFKNINNISGWQELNLHYIFPKYVYYLYTTSYLLINKNNTKGKV